MKAFPSNHQIPEYMDLKELGMDLRDYFASKSLPLAFKVWENYHNSEENDETYKTSNFQLDGNYQELVAETAYEMADAMLKARNEKL